MTRVIPALVLGMAGAWGQEIGRIEALIGYSMTWAQESVSTPLLPQPNLSQWRINPGAVASLNLNVNRHLRIVLAEVAGQLQSSGLDLLRNQNVDVSELLGVSTGRLARYHLLAGPEWTIRYGRSTFFVRALAGAASQQALRPAGNEVDPTAEVKTRWGFALGFGGGYEVRLGRHWTLRAAQIDFIPARMGPEDIYLGNTLVAQLPEWQNQWRFQAGFTASFGTR